MLLTVQKSGSRKCFTARMPQSPDLLEPRFYPAAVTCPTNRDLAALSQLRIFFGFFAPIFIIKACVFIGALPENGIVETKCLPFDDGLLAVCRQHVST